MTVSEESLDRGWRVETKGHNLRRGSSTLLGRLFIKFHIIKSNNLYSRVRLILILEIVPDVLGYAGTGIE